jgi:DNA repair exonuclease SbcCD ATPase subunit
MISDAPGRHDSGEEESRGLRERLSSQAEDRIGKLADDLLENPMINSALQTAFGARERVAQAQETAMEALNLPSASNLEKLARRMRSVSQRLDEIEDSIERIARRLGSASEAGSERTRLTERLERVDSRLDELAQDVAALRRELTPGEGIAAAQTRVIPEG